MTARGSMISRLRPRRRDDEGASAVEFALVVPLLLMIAFGIIAFGLVLFSQISATHAAREAVRQLAVNNPDLDSCTELSTYLSSKSGFAPTDITVTSDGDGSAGDQLTLSFQVPTSEGAVGAFAGITSIIPGGQVLLPDSLSIQADGRIEESGPVSQAGCS